MDGKAKSEQAAGDAPIGPRPGARRRTVCLLATRSPDPGLSIALQQHLSEEVREIEFTLNTRRKVDAIWVCGYEPGHERAVRALRRRYPSAVILVTGREPVEAWQGEVARAGADFAFVWPVALQVLRTVLQGGMPSKSLRSRRAAVTG